VADTVATMSPQLATTSTVRSSLVLQGVEEASEALQTVVRTALATTLEVDEERVVVLGMELVTDDVTRRLMSGFRVRFEVISVRMHDAVAADNLSSNSSVLANGTGSDTSLIATLEALDSLQGSPEILQENLVAAFRQQGTEAPPTLQVSVAAAEVQRAVVGQAAGSWSACREETSLHRTPPCSDVLGTRIRKVFCIDIDNASSLVPSTWCSGLTPLPAIEACVVTAVERYPDCTEDLSTSLPSPMPEATMGVASTASVHSASLGVVCAGVVFVIACSTACLCRKRCGRRRQELLDLTFSLDFEEELRGEASCVEVSAEPTMPDFSSDAPSRVMKIYPQKRRDKLRRSIAI